MTNSTRAHNLPNESSATLDDVLATWQMFRGLDRLALERWGLFVFGPYAGLLITAIAADLLGGSANRSGAIPATGFLSLLAGARWTMDNLTDWIFVSLTLALALAAIATVRWSKQIPETLERLWRGDRLRARKSGDDVQTHYRDYLSEYQRKLFSPARYWVIGALVFAAFGFAVWSMQARELARALPTQANAAAQTAAALNIAIRWIIAPVVWAYFAGVGAWTMYATSWFVLNLPERVGLKINPSHPDQCGGMKLLGDVCLSGALILLIAAVFFGAFGIVFGDLGYAFFANLILIAVVLPLAALAFLLPLWNIHTEMDARRKQDEDEYAQRVADWQEQIRGHLAREEWAEAKAAKDRLDIQQALNPNKTGYPVWPLDRGMLLRFLSPQLIPFAGIIFNLNDTMKKILESAWKIIIGQ